MDCTKSINSEIAQLAAEVALSSHRICNYVQKTPMIRLPWLDTPQRQVWAKVECWQQTGSFKIRGAYNALLQLPDDAAVITASAGNHGLGIAAAAAALGRSCRVCVPVNASELKVRRLIDSGAQIYPIGADLYAAANFAQAEAQCTGAHYISAYSNRQVIAGQGTCAVEMAEGPESFDTIVVPLGGGGLLCGVGAFMKSLVSRPRIVAAYPQVFGRALSRTTLEQQMAKSVVPTIADGLAVQTEADSWVVGHLKDIVDDYLPVMEQSIEIAIYALLRNQSLLVEGAGAISVATLLNDPDANMIKGRVAVILSGGNISSTALSQSMSVQVEDSRLRSLLGLRTLKTALDLEGVSRSVTTVTPVTNFSNESDLSTDAKSQFPLGEPHLEWIELLSRLQTESEQLAQAVERHRSYAAQQGLPTDPLCHTVMDQQLELAGAFIGECLDDSQATLPALRARYRLLLQLNSSLHNVLHWTSAAYDQSREVNFFDPLDQQSTAVNYTRYGSVRTRNFEIKLTQWLDLDAAHISVLATSSGQAAYQLSETFLLREVLQANDCVVYAPYIYFEAMEQMASLPHLRHIVASSYDVDALIQLVEAHDAKVLYVDPLANIAGLPTIDLHELAHKLKDYDWRNRWIVIDGTMVSGGINPFKWFARPNHPEIIYYESASKYLQMGLDIQLAGFCAIKTMHAAPLYRYRRNSGSILYPLNSSQFPSIDRAIFLRRMRRLSRNAEQLANAISQNTYLNAQLLVAYPCQWPTLLWDHGGSIVTIKFNDDGLNNRDRLESFIHLLLQRCQRSAVALTKGVSFGFNVTRVSAAAAIAQHTDPFLRFSVGDEPADEMDNICAVVIASLLDYITGEECL